MRSPQDDLQDEGARPAGPVSDTGLSLPGESSASSPPAGDASEADVQAVEEDFEKLLADAHQEKEEYLELARRTKAQAGVQLLPDDRAASFHRGYGV